MSIVKKGSLVLLTKLKGDTRYNIEARDEVRGILEKDLSLFGSIIIDPGNPAEKKTSSKIVGLQEVGSVLLVHTANSVYLVQPI